MRTEFFVPCEPPRATSQSAGKRVRIVGKVPMFFKSRKAKDAEAMLAALFLPYKPIAPYVGPVSLSVRLYFPWRKSEPLKNRSCPKPHTTKPDCSNAVKMIEDTLVRLRFLMDDAGVSELYVSKFWADEPGIGIVIQDA